MMFTKLNNVTSLDNTLPCNYLSLDCAKIALNLDDKKAFIQQNKIHKHFLS